jgi:hypothetical protein
MKPGAETSAARSMPISVRFSNAIAALTVCCQRRLDGTHRRSSPKRGLSHNAP